MTLVTRVIPALIAGLALVAVALVAGLARAGPRWSASAFGGLAASTLGVGIGGCVRGVVEVVPEIVFNVETGYFGLGRESSPYAIFAPPDVPSPPDVAIRLLAALVEMRAEGARTRPFMSCGAGMYDRIETRRRFPASIMDAETHSYRTGMSFGVGIAGKDAFTPAIEFRVHGLLGDVRPNALFTATVGLHIR